MTPPSTAPSAREVGPRRGAPSRSVGALDAGSRCRPDPCRARAGPRSASRRARASTASGSVAGVDRPRRQVDRDAAPVRPRLRRAARRSASRTRSALAGVDPAGRPQRVRARQRGVAAQRDLDRRREPAQIEAAGRARQQERRLDRFISAATPASSRRRAARRGGTTAAGLPPNGPVVNASICRRRETRHARQ